MLPFDPTNILLRYAAILQEYKDLYQNSPLIAISCSGEYIQIRHQDMLAFAPLYCWKVEPYEYNGEDNYRATLTQADVKLLTLMNEQEYGEILAISAQHFLQRLSSIKLVELSIDADSSPAS